MGVWVSATSFGGGLSGYCSSSCRRLPLLTTGQQAAGAVVHCELQQQLKQEEEAQQVETGGQVPSVGSRVVTERLS